MTIFKNDKIRTKYGSWYTVEMIYGNMVYVYETNNVIHINNIVEIIKF